MGRSADEERAEVTAVEVVGDVASDDPGVCVEEVEVALALLGGELEGDVDELAEAAVETRVRRLVAERGGVRWYDDSKATTPHAARTAIRAFGSVVLVAGGRNKGLDLAPLAEESGRVRGVVAIGEAAPELEAAFGGRVEVARASSMDDAVEAASRMAREGDVVLLSPACASYDWYRNYGERGDDFARAVRARLGLVAAGRSS